MTEKHEAIIVGLTGRHEITTEDPHSAEAYGNPGVRVVASPALVGFVETACHNAIENHLTPGQATVGVRLELNHLAAAPIGATVVSTARVVKVDGNRVRFEAEAHAGDTLLMDGYHERVLVDYDRLVAGLQKRFGA